MTRLAGFVSLLATLTALVLVAAPASAQRTVTADDSVAVVRPSPPLPLSVGTGSGFGGMLGTDAGRDVTIAWDTDVLGRVTFTLRNATCTGANDVIVIYLDTVGGSGFADTTMFTDTFSLEARAVSATPDGATLTFPTGFRAEYAIAVRNQAGSPAAFLYELTASGGHVARSLGTNQPAGLCNELRVGGFTLTHMGMAQGDEMRWFATLLNGSNGFRSNEFHGVAEPAANIGAIPFTLAAGDYNVFTTIGPLVINEIDAQTPGTDVDEFIELFGPPNARLDGAVLVAWNGATDTSYNLAPFTSGIDLDGQTLDAGGFWVAGNAAVPGADVTFNDSALQQGPDAVSVHLANGADFAAGTALSASNLVDGVAYDDTGDTDAQLTMFFPGTVREDGGTLSNADASNQRCPDGGGGPLDISAFEQWTPSPGATNVCPCGDGSLDAGEQCDDGRALNGTTGSCCDVGCTFRAVGASCGAPPSGACDAQDSCDGAGACLATLQPAGSECRASAGDCDLAESCDGVSVECPSDVLAASTVECRAGAGACDVAESCTGASAACPGDLFAADGTPCADAMVCDGAEMCLSGACAAGTAPSCDDGDACTADACAEPAGCASTIIAGCCNVDGDCDDSNVCTADACSGAGGTCSASPITGCCVVDGDCDDGNACTTNTCNTTANTCESAAVPSCCGADADCDDDDACTTDACTVATGECVNAEVAECCLTDGDCDDADTCTMDRCGADMTCTNDALAGCCTTDADCDDGDACTTDACTTATATCANEAITGCGDADAGMGGDAGSGADAGMTADGGTAEVRGGCGCRALGHGSDGSAAWLLAAIGLALLGRRRARARRLS